MVKSKKRKVLKNGRVKDVFKKGSDPLQPFEEPIFAVKVGQRVEYLPEGLEFELDEPEPDIEKEAIIIGGPFDGYTLVTLMGSNPSVVAKYCTIKNGVPY